MTTTYWYRCWRQLQGVRKTRTTGNEAFCFLVRCWLLCIGAVVFSFVDVVCSNCNTNYQDTQTLPFFWYPCGRFSPFLHLSHCHLYGLYVVSFIQTSLTPNRQDDLRKHRVERIFMNKAYTFPKIMRHNEFYHESCNLTFSERVTILNSSYPSPQLIAAN